jgi:hypothetical protein
MTQTENLRLFLLGVLAMGDLIATFFFVKYWKRTRHRFFLYFAVSFGVEVLCRFLLIYTTSNSETEPLVYGLRLLSYLVILAGIADINRVSIGKYVFSTFPNRGQ